MTPLALVLTVVVLLSAKTLASIYVGGGYVCPVCGTRRKGQHADDCPWSR
jgi:hypothetical protein